MAEDINKLPKWAQDKIKTLERQRDTAVKALNSYLDEQTVSAFYVQEFLTTGEKHGPSLKNRYIQTHQMSVVHEGVCLNVLLRDDRIDLSWGGASNRTMDVACIPHSFQNVHLVSRSKMRD